MKRFLPLLLLLLLFPTTAQAHFTTQGYQEIVQDGTRIDYVLGLETEALYTLADGRDKATLSAYLLPRVRVSSDGERCDGRLVGSTAQRRGGVNYLRLALQYECASADGPFSVRYAVPNENLARFELGGQSGTFMFDPDNMVLRADDPPGFLHFIEEGVEHIVLGWDHVVFLVILLLGAQDVPRRGQARDRVHGRPQRDAGARHPRRGRRAERDRRAADRRLDRLRRGDAGARRGERQEAHRRLRCSDSSTGSASRVR